MKFPKSSCMKIVQEISNIIGERVNMMDHEGMIIASTDPARIGTFHAGAKRVVEERLEILTIHGNEEYEGAKPGQTRTEAAEIRELKKRNRLLEQENEVLRRAAAYLSQANLPGKGSTRS